VEKEPAPRSRVKTRAVRAAENLVEEKSAVVDNSTSQHPLWKTNVNC